MNLLRKKNIDTILQNRTKLQRTFSAFDLTLLGLGAIIGTGIFVISGIAALEAGPGLLLSFVIAAIACSLSAMSYAEFASIVPISGSVYTYSYITLGEFVAWIIGWDMVLQYLLAASSVAVGWSGYFQSFLVGIGIPLPTLLSSAPGEKSEFTLFNLPTFLIILTITFLLSQGSSSSKKLNNIMVFVKILVIFLFVTTGIGHVRLENMQPFLPFGIHGIFSAAALVFYAYLGFDAIATAAEETRNPQRDLPKGILFSLGISTLLYMAVAFVTIGIVPFQLFQSNVDHPISLAIEMTNQYWISGIIDVGAVLGMTTVMIVVLYGLSRITYSMSADGLIPRVFSYVHPKYRTPYKSTWLLGITASCIGAFIPLKILSQLANIGTLFAFSAVSLGVLILRKTHPTLNRTFRCPGVPYVPLAGIVISVLLMFFLEAIAWFAFLVWMSIGILIYFSYSRKNSVLGKEEPK